MSSSIPLKLACVLLPLVLVIPAASVFGYPEELQEVGEFKPLGLETKEILLYYGNGGQAPPGAEGRAIFYDLKAYYDGIGFPTTYTNTWPADLKDYRVIFLIMPGWLNDLGIYYFSSTRVDQFKDFLMNGGRLVVQGEHSGIFGVDTVNKLLSDLGVGIQQRSDNRLFYIDPAADDITADQITVGVDELDMDGAGVSSLTISGTAKSLVRDRVGYHLVAVDQIAGAPPRPGSDVVVYGDTQVLDDHQLRNIENDAGYYDNLIFADNLIMWQPVNQPPEAVLSPPSQTIFEGQTADFSGYGSFDPDPKVDMIFVVDTSPSMPDEWTILTTTLPQIEADLIAQGYDLDFVVYGMDHGTETPTKFPVMDDWLDYGARYDVYGNILQDCLRNKIISNPNSYNVETGNPSPGLIDPTKRCDYYNKKMSEGWAQGSAYMALNFPWREDSTRIVVPIGDSAPWTQLGDGSPGKSWWGNPFVVQGDWDVINETSEILNDNDVIAFPMYDESIDPTGPVVGVQQALFISMGEQTGGGAFAIDDAQSFLDNVNVLIKAAILDYSWDFDANEDVDWDGNYINDNEATGMNVSHTYYDDCVCTVTLTVTDVGGASAQAQAGIIVLNVAPSVQWTSENLDEAELNPPYPEGDNIQFNAIYYDPGIYDTHTFDWDFGDGTILLGGASSEVHAYGDNDTYTVILTVTDDDGGIGVDDTPPLETYNVDPDITDFVHPPSTVYEGTTPYDLVARFTDPGWLDTHNGVIDWGDGTVVVAGLAEENFEPDATGRFSASHIYGDNGVFSVSATVYDDDGGSDTSGTSVSVANLPPEVTVKGSNIINEGDSVTLTADITDAGSDDVSITWDWGDGTTETRDYFNDGVGPDPPNSPLGLWPMGVQDIATHAYGDNGDFTVSVTVTDDDGGAATVTETVYVLNVAPTISAIGAFVNASIVFRIAGEKWHDVEFYLYEDGVEMGYAHLTRYPGSPDDQAVTLANVSLTFSSRFSFVAYYTPDDDPINGQENGANPGWVILKFEDGTQSRLHHTFNVMHPETYVWEEDDLNPYLVGHNVSFLATASDVGSDDLTFEWDWGDSTLSSNTYYNNGISPDPTMSPDINPITITDYTSHAYSTVGPFTFTLTVYDDDGGSATMTYVF